MLETAYSIKRYSSSLLFRYLLPSCCGVVIGIVIGRAVSSLIRNTSYIGEKQNGKKHGYGKYTEPTGATYEGEWVEGKPHGQGTTTYPNGNICYVGQVQAGKAHGHGKHTDPTGDTYEGEWVEGKKHGQGTITDRNGNILCIGQFQAGKVHGHGKVTDPTRDGEIYEGEWVEGKEHGHGKLIEPTGTIYEGEWIEGKRHGRGKLTSAQGRTYEGFWKYGIIDLTPEAAVEASEQGIFISGLLGLDFGIEISLCNGLALTILANQLNHPLLKQADFLQKIPFQDAVQAIQSKLAQEGSEILLSYQARGHALGLGMKRDGENLTIRIFNSGAGLVEYHKSREAFLFSHYLPNNKMNRPTKFETEWKIRVPYVHATDSFFNQLEKLQDKNTCALYDFLLAIPGAAKIESLNPIWQTPQKGKNCSVEWIFAYLKNSMEEIKYHQLRIELFQKCLAVVLKKPDSHARDVIIEILKNKIAKRESKIAQLAIRVGEKGSA